MALARTDPEFSVADLNFTSQGLERWSSERKEGACRCGVVLSDADRTAVVAGTADAAFVALLEQHLGLSAPLCPCCRESRDFIIQVCQSSLTDAGDVAWRASRARAVMVAQTKAAAADAGRADFDEDAELERVRRERSDEAMAKLEEDEAQLREEDEAAQAWAESDSEGSESDADEEEADVPADDDVVSDDDDDALAGFCDSD